MLASDFDKGYLQKLQDRFAAASKTAVIIIDDQANAVTTLSNPECLTLDIIQNNDDFSQACASLLKQALSAEEHVCRLHSQDGFAVGCVPVYSDDMLISGWVICGHDLTLAIDLLAVFSDELITLHHSKTEIKEENDQLPSLTENLPGAKAALELFNDVTDVGMYMVDYNTCEIIICNNAYANAYGKTSEELIGKVCWKLLGYSERCGFCVYKNLLDDDNNPKPAYTWEFKLEQVSPPRWYRCTSRAVTWVDGRLAHMISFLDITSRKEMEEKLQSIAYFDRRMGVPNYAHLDNDLRVLSGDACLLVLDIAGLHKINDVYGRACGDLLLDAVKNYIIELEIPDSTLYRLESADFAILVKNHCELSAMKSIVEQILLRCNYEWQLQLGGNRHDVFITINTCIIPIDKKIASDFDNLLNIVEQTLGVARQTAKTALYDRADSESVHTRIKMELSLRNAVINQMSGFFLYFQPIVDPGVAMWCGMEALCRWNSADFGMVSPGQFINMAETTGLICTIGEWVLVQAIKQTKRWGLDKLEHFVLDVNLSALQLSMENLDQIVMNILEAYDYPPHKLGMEVTESSEVNFNGQTLKAITRLNSLGVIITLDDFGTGYASFNILHKLPVKMLKTDRSFVIGMENDAYLQHLFQIMVELAHASNMRFVAEGIETLSQAQLLLKHGVDLFQGYYFSKPLSVEDMEKSLNNFYSPIRELVSLGYSPMDILSLTDPEKEYFLTPTLNNLLTHCLQILFHVPDNNSAIGMALKHIGVGLKVGRSYVFLKQDDGTYSMVMEWCAEGIAPQKADQQHVHMPPLWSDTLRDFGIIIESDARLVSDEAIRDMLTEHGIKSLAVFPIWKSGDLYGFVGFNECSRNRIWTSEEVRMLHRLTGIITSTLSKMWMQEQIIAQGQVLESVLNNMYTCVSVIDPETHELLFVNNEFKNLMGEDSLGKKCWEAIRCADSPCSFCPTLGMEKVLGNTLVWEYYNDTLDRHYLIRDSIIAWKVDRLVHLHYAEDITHIKDYQNKLELYAQTDLFTSTLNRLSFIKEAQELQKKAYENNMPMTLAFVDLDGLKKENDTRGHTAGDIMIMSVVQVLRECTDGENILGRYGGDEFVLTFYGSRISDAELKMINAIENLKCISSDKGRDIPYSFSYGLVENSELPYTDNDAYYIESLLRIADSRMFIQKDKKYGRTHCDSAVADTE